MNTNTKLIVCGSITKTETLVPLDAHTLPNTWVAEANFPYSNYYGQVPREPKPNSIFLFTNKHYHLEEILHIKNNLPFCSDEDFNLASALLCDQDHQYFAIRVKNFPNYSNLKGLQECLQKLGIHFAPKIPLVRQVEASINKCFYLRKVEESLYFDEVDQNNGYVETEIVLDRGKINEVLDKIRNNSNCPLFDGAAGGFIMDGQSVGFIRIYAENMNADILKLIQKTLKLIYKTEAVAK